MSANGHSAGPKKHLFILLNGKKCGNMELRSAVMDLRKEGHDVSVRVIYEKPDTERYVEEFLGLDSGAILVAAGGDGSINEVANSLLRHKAPDSTQLALIPLGTANDLCTGLEIPTDPRQALEVALSGSDGYPVDLGMVNDQAFVNVATGGFGTELTVKTDENLKKSMGGAAYVLTGITSFSDITSKAATVEARSLTSTAQLSERSYEILSQDNAEWPKDERGSTLEPVGPDSRACLEGALLILAVGNGRQAGGGMELCPDADFGDGLLDVTYIMDPVGKDLDIPKLLRFMTDPRGDGGAREILREEVNCYGTLRCKEVEVSCESGLQINCDGEPVRDTHFSFSVLPQRLRLHLPHPQLLSQPRPERQRLSQLWEQQAKREQFKGLDTWRMTPMPGVLCCATRQTCGRPMHRVSCKAMPLLGKSRQLMTMCTLRPQPAVPCHLASVGPQQCQQRSTLSARAFFSSSAEYASPPRPASGEVLIELDNVHKRFGSKRVLQGCNIQIRRGEAVGIIGGSGSGKSTTLRLMAGLMAPDWGDVRIKGQKREGVLGDDPELGKLLQVGMVFQHSALFDSLTVGDNVGFLLREHSSLAPPRIKELVAASLDAVGLHGVEHLYPSELSGGMQKRVALARAIIRDSDNPGPEQVIMYDEPTAGLDPVASTVVEDLIRSLQVARETGQRSAAEIAGVASYIVVTHQHSTIRRAVDRLVFLHQGKVVWQGKTDEFDTTDEPIVSQFRSGKLDGPIRYD